MISVIIPSYNRENKLIESIHSVLKQTYKDIEVIVVDDASTDNTEKAVRAIDDDRIRYFRQNINLGACAARNKGIELSRGELVAFQDSDDIWRPEKLEKQLNFLTEHGSDMVYCGMDRIYKGKKEYFPKQNGDQITIEELLSGNKISTQTILVRKVVAEDNKFDDKLRRFQDWDFALRILEKSYKINYLKESLVIARVGNDSISITEDSEKAYLQLADKHFLYYKDYPQSYADVCLKIAYRLRKSDRKKCRSYLIKSLQLKPSILTVIKLGLNLLHIW